ncbi:hypothetical protein MXB_4996, partial [Myxobolus squamalis]
MVEELNEISHSISTLETEINEFSCANISLLNLYVKDLKELKNLIQNNKTKRAKLKSHCLRTLDRDLDYLQSHYITLHSHVSTLGRIINT